MPLGERDQYVLCPYYKRDAPCGVSCEGPAEGTSTTIHFQSRETKLQYMAVYCEDNYPACMVCKMLDAKYELDIAYKGDRYI